VSRPALARAPASTPPHSFGLDIARHLATSGFWVGRSPVQALGSKDWQSLVTASDQLPRDVYAPGSGRSRTFNRLEARAGGDGGVVVSLLASDTPYSQDAAYNPELGGLARHYPPSAVLGAGHAAIEEIAGRFAPALCALSGVSRLTINVHHIRYEATPGSPAWNSPSGWHKDGERFISVHLIARRGIEGGANRVAGNDRRELAEFLLAEPGDCFLIDDTRVWHAVDEIRAAPGATRATRDILLIDYLPVAV
jgi:hypothetical protein